jgi:hypothetical protein
VIFTVTLPGQKESLFGQKEFVCSPRTSYVDSNEITQINRNFWVNKDIAPPINIFFQSE